MDDSFKLYSNILNDRLNEYIEINQKQLDILIYNIEQEKIKLDIIKQEFSEIKKILKLLLVKYNLYNQINLNYIF